MSVADGVSGTLMVILRFPQQVSFVSMRVSRVIVVPQTKDGCCPTLTAVYDALGPANLLSCGHFPKAGVMVVYEEE